MRYVAAYLLAVLGGNDKPSESDIKKILSSVGIDADSVCLKKVISELKDKNVDEVISAGQLKLAAMPTVSASVVSTAAAPAKAEEPNKVEKKEEPESEEEDEDMGFGLFD